LIDLPIRNQQQIKENKQQEKKTVGFELLMTSPINTGSKLILEKIIGITKIDGQSMFLMKYKEHNGEYLVPYNEAKANYPLDVINFFEERLVWNVPDMDDM